MPTLEAHKLATYSQTDKPCNHKNDAQSDVIMGINISNTEKKLGFSIAIGYELDGPDSIPSGGKIFVPVHSVQTSSGAHPVSYPMGLGG
jgi:hypothetical protein